MSVSFAVRRADPASVDTPLLAVVLGAGSALSGQLRALDEALSGALSRTLQRGDFGATRDETLHLAGGPTGPARVLLVGMPAGAQRALDVRRAGAVAGRTAHRLGVGELTVLLDGASAADVEPLAVGVGYGAWEYMELKSPPPAAERKLPLSRATILVDDERAGSSAATAASAIVNGLSLARRLAMMPGNLCTPDYLVETAADIAQRHAMRLTVLGRAELEQERMGSFLCVAQGTPQDPKLISVEYRGGASDAPPLVLVGKGLCFDTGGISIKPAERMEFMKFDMCGAAGVLGAMEAIGRLGVAVNVVGLVGATTNMPSGTAVKPGDVVRSQLGKTIEIINTDAEGRLVLADVLSYARRFRPAAVVDAATLTGACVIALGHAASGVFGTDDALVGEVLDAGQRAAEPGWRLPLWDEYREQIKSDVADIKNTGGRAAGAVTAAMFLKEFADDFPWVHLDIAGTAYSETDRKIMPPGPTGVPTGTFIELARGRAG